MASSASTNRSSPPQRFCKYIHRYCNQTRLEGYDYCIRHILEDKTAPFKQCMYVNQPNKKRCTNAAPKNDKNDKRENVFCPFHAKRAMLKVRISAPKKKLVEGPVALLKSLEHYCHDPNHDSSSKRDAANFDKSDISACKGEAPTTLSDLEPALDEDKPVQERARIDNVDDDFCWVEKFGDSLANAGAYTHKEILTIAKEKILYLQQLYCEELKVVYHQLKENRREFLSALHSSQVSTSELPSQKSDETSLHALMQHHRRSGAERVLRHKVQTKRLNTDKTSSVQQNCTYERNGKQCKHVAIVLTKFCKNHILFDQNQLLFKPCPSGLKKKCKKPVLILEEDEACDMHLHRLLKSKLGQSRRPSSTEVAPKAVQVEPEPFQSMDDIASLGLDATDPGSLFGLDQYGEPGESTDTVLSEDQADLMQIQPISLTPPADILSDSRKSESE